MLLHQDVINFLHSALECSIYVNPTDPGLTFGELAEAARRADFLEGEINDSIPHIATQSFGPQSQKVQLNKNHALLLVIFHGREEPEYRNAAAFHGVFSAMRKLLREKGVANAHIERSSLIERVVSDTVTENDAQIAVTILVINEVLLNSEGIISFAKGSETYGSPGDPGNWVAPQREPFLKDTRARAYPIVQKLIEERNGLTPSPRLGRPEDSITDTNQKMSNDGWLDAATALDLLGQSYYSGTRAICKRAHAGLIKARAKRFIKDNQIADNVEVPSQFWWAKGEASLKQNWSIGDFDTWIDKKFHLKAFGVEFLRSDIEDMKTTSNERLRVGNGKVFIGHGRSPAWRELRDFLQGRLRLTAEEFNSVPTAGIPTPMRLEEMLDNAAFAFLVLTAEDAQSDGTVHARLNVVHEAGLFQGRLGFNKAIILLEEGCEGFSNINGLGQIRFSSNGIDATFERVRQVLERENIIVDLNLQP